jgi:O-antigen ligase
MFVVYYKPKILIGAIPALIVVLIILPQPVKKRLFSIFDLNDVTNKDRLHMVYTGIKIFKDFPLTGVGPDNIKMVYPNYRHPQAEKNNPHLHNNFLQILSERGIFAFICVIAAFLVIFINLLAKIKNSVQYPKTIALGVLFMYIGFQVMGLFEYNFGDTEIKFMLFYFLSIPFLHFKSAESPDDGGLKEKP